MSINKQAIFDKTWLHFVVNKGQPGYDQQGTRCIYGGIGDTNRCAIGIHDERGALTGRECAVESLQAREIRLVFEDYEAHTDLKFLGSLQYAHDSPAPFSADFHQRIESTLRDLARLYELTVPA